MDKRKVCIIFNPAARGGKALSLYAELKALAGDVPIFTSEEANAITDLAASVVKQGYNHVIAGAGGRTGERVCHGPAMGCWPPSVFGVASREWFGLQRAEWS